MFEPGSADVDIGAAYPALILASGKEGVVGAGGVV